jgi:hypothetical protein
MTEDLDRGASVTGLGAALLAILGTLGRHVDDAARFGASHADDVGRAFISSSDDFGRALPSVADDHARRSQELRALNGLSGSSESSLTPTLHAMDESSVPWNLSREVIELSIKAAQNAEEDRDP